MYFSGIDPRAVLLAEIIYGVLWITGVVAIVRLVQRLVGFDYRPI